MAALPAARDPREVPVEPGRIHSLTGTIRLHPGFRSRFLTAERDVWVWLPPGYETEPRRGYPVLYLQDGQNIFDGATSYLPGVEWRVDETAQRLVLAGEIAPLIVVAIANSGAGRSYEYRPPPVSQIHRDGGADRYGRLLVEDLLPAIAAEYRVLPEAAQTGLGGSSLGGAIALYLGLRYPRVFGRLAVLSPGLRTSADRIRREIAALPAKPATRIWLDVGTGEGAAFVGSARLARAALLAKGWAIGRDLAYYEQPGGRHGEAAWAQRVAPCLRFLFPAG